MRANVYCGNLLWQSSLTLPAPLYDLYKKLRQYLEKPPVTCDCVKPIYIYMKVSVIMMAKTVERL